MQPFETARYHCLFSSFSLQEIMSLSELKTPCRCSLYMMWLLGLVNPIQYLPKFVYAVPAALLKNAQATLGAQTEISSPVVWLNNLTLLSAPFLPLVLKSLSPKPLAALGGWKHPQICACVTVSRHISSTGSMPLLALRAGYISRSAEGNNNLLQWLWLINNVS